MLNNEFPPLGGGTGTVNQALLGRWARVPALEIDLITSAEGARAEQLQWGERIHIFKLPVNRFDVHHASNGELSRYSARALKRGWQLHRAKRYDLCMAWSAVPAGAVAFALKQLTGLPYIVRVCGPDIPGFEQRYGALYKLLTPLIRATWRGAHSVVAKCGGESEMVRRVDPQISPINIANGVDAESFKPGAPIPDMGPLRLICVARLIERKGQHHLIRAVKQITDGGFDVTLELIGTGDAHSANEQLARELGVTERVRFLGYVPREQIAHYYANAHVFVLASFNEGMSVATLEAMAAGLPVVVTRTPGTRELVQEGVNGLTLDWGDTDRLVSHLRYLAEHRALARRMGVASRARALAFSWDTAANRFLELFGAINRPALMTNPTLKGETPIRPSIEIET